MSRRLTGIAVAIALSSLAGSGFAQSTLSWGSGPVLLDEYVTYIGPSDVRSSTGTRLTEAWQVIRQDRANYHRFNVRDRGDQGDSFFGSAQNRAIMERMVRDGRMSPSAAQAVVRGGVWVTVRIYGRGSQGQSLDITVN